jgi:hypothetical protein
MESMSSASGSRRYCRHNPSNLQGDVTSLTIGDINLGAARKLAGELNGRLGSEKVRAVHVDANLTDTGAGGPGGI